jgi:integrase
VASITWRGNSAELSFVIHFVDDGGCKRKKRERISLGTISAEQAERARQIKELELATGVVVDTQAHLDKHRAAQRLTLSDFFRDRYAPWFARMYPSSVTKLHTCMKHLEPTFGRLALSDITTIAVEDWKTARLGEHVTYRLKDGTLDKRRPVSNETVRKEMNTLRAILRRAMKWKLISAVPCADVEPVPRIRSKRKRFLTKDELERIYAASLNGRDHWWRFIANTGLRRGEAWRLRRSVHIRGDVILLESDEENQTKSRRMRTIPLNAVARAALAHLGDDYLFPRYRPWVFGKFFATDAERAGVRASIHDLRHSYGTHMAAARVPLHRLQAYMGHANIKTTMGYLGHDAEAAQSDADLIAL